MLCLHFAFIGFSKKTKQNNAYVYAERGNVNNKVLGAHIILSVLL